MREINIGSKIKQLRRRAGMTQAEFASRIGVTNITVSKWENERQMPSLSRMAKLERVLGAESADQTVVDGLFDSPGPRSDRIGVTAVMTGVVVSLKTGVALPESSDTGVGRPLHIDAMTIDCPGPGSTAQSGPGARSQQAARDGTVDTGDDAGAVVDLVARDSNELGWRCTGEHSTPNGVGELIDFNPYDPDEHPALSGIYVLYDVQ
jgi:transcriptional regulator with XRE-family HTH domain